MRQCNEYKIQVLNYEEKIKLLNQEIGLWMNKYKNVEKEVKKVEYEKNRVSRSCMEESQRKSKEIGREVEGLKMQVRLLQEENSNLQKIMDKELGKRKTIIEELIQEKKVLY